MLPPCFREVEAKEEDAVTAKGNRTNKRKKDDTKDKRKKQKEGNPNLAVKNEHQCIDFKLREGKHGQICAGSKVKERAKLNGTFMCGCWHTRGNCFLDCKNKASHVPCSKIHAKVKQVHMQWMKKVQREE
jgi:hypothetical protein